MAGVAFGVVGRALQQRLEVGVPSVVHGLIHQRA